MPVESAADLASFFNSDEFGDEILYQPLSGESIGAAANWIHPGGMGRLSSTEVASDVHLFMVRRSEVPNPVAGGHVQVIDGPRFLIVHEPEASPDGALWHLSAAPVG